jgi:hypothetical protein
MKEIQMKVRYLKSVGLVRLALMFSFLLLTLGGLVGCTDDSTRPRTTAFRLQLEITDSGGDPVPGLRVSAWTRIPPEFTQDGRLGWGDSKPMSRFPFAVAESCSVTYVIYDADDNAICTIADGTYPPGESWTAWPGTLCDLPGNEPALAGAYRARFAARDLDTEEVIFEDEIVAVMYLADPEQTILGYANEGGEFTTTRKEFFPHLQTWEPFTAVDEEGNPIGQFSYLDTVRVALTDTAAHQTQYFDVVVDDKPNTFALTWDPTKHQAAPVADAGVPATDPQPVAPHLRPGSTGPRPHDTNPMPCAAKDDPQPVPTEFRVKQNVPNPFN